MVEWRSIPSVAEQIAARLAKVIAHVETDPNVKGCGGALGYYADEESIAAALAADPGLRAVVESQQEMTAACAAAFRAMAHGIRSELQPIVMDAFERELRAAGIRDGFGVRAREALELAAGIIVPAAAPQ